MVGVAQMTLLLPGMLLMLLGGSVADRIGGRIVATVGQAAAGFAPLVLLLLVSTGRLTLTGMLVYAVIMGSASAFVTPARDGLLNVVASGRIQRTVMLTSIIQFGLQIVGFLIASLADTLGPESILGFQSLVLLTGAIGFLYIREIRPPVVKQGRLSLVASIVEGAKTVLGSTPMRAVVVQNVAMALFFMGSFMVTLPLLVRDVFHGSASDLAFINAANSLGIVVSMVLLVRYGDLHRQGRALMLAQGAGAVALCVSAFAPGYGWFVFVLFWWGSCGGIAMSMSRTIMQELAPEDQRGRVMGFYAFSFVGAGPLGALLSGYLVEHIGAREALICSSLLMAVVVLTMSLRSSLWRLQVPSVIP